MAEDEGVKKLRTYKKLKHHFSIEPHLEAIHDFDMRKCISSFRISAHKLRIEQGRDKGERLEEILCEECNEVETEVHFMSMQKVLNL